MEASLRTEDWDGVERHAAALECFTRHEPVPWTRFFIARGRALAAYGRGQRGRATIGGLRRLRDEADRAGLKAALPALDQALAAA